MLCCDTVMMFNGLLVCADSDNSDVTKDSGGACSLVDSATGSCDGNEQATYYHNKLLSTLQILRNREETIRVQAESLAVAEERIAALTERANDLKRDLDRKSKEMHALRQTLECCRTEKVDVSVTAKGISEVENQSDIMNTLQSNLGIIEDLYRECFYETAKQEDLIDMLRKSYLDVRLMDKQKAAQIGRLQNVINTQKLSLDRCQEISLEVDTLKMEISSFLSSSASTNNDSGMWERSEESFTSSAPEVQEDLQEITEQLLRLREILTGPCVCGLGKEIARLKQENEELEKQNTEFCRNKCELEQMLQTKNTLEKKLKDEVQTKEDQLKQARKELLTTIESSNKKTCICDQMCTQLRQTQEILIDKSEELVRLKLQYDVQQETIEHLQQEVKKTEQLCQENSKLCCDVSSLTAQEAQTREALAQSEQHARRLEARLRHAELCYSEKENNASELKSQLEEAKVRGAALCGDVRRVLGAARCWAHRVRAARREQDKIIKEKDDLIASLQDRLKTRADNSASCESPGLPDELPCCSCSRKGSCSRVETRLPKFMSEDEIASCSSAPTPPRRLYKKKPCAHGCALSPWLCDASEQQPVLKDGCQDPKVPYSELRASKSTRATADSKSGSHNSNCHCSQRTMTDPNEKTPGQKGKEAHTLSNASATEELFRRVEVISDAMTDALRRWTRADAR